MYKTTNCRGRNGLANSIRSLVGLVIMLVGGITWAQTTGTVQIGSGTETSTGSQAIPVTNYVYNYNQQIVTSSEIAVGGGAVGEITKIRYQATSVGTMTVWNQWTVYIGNTTKTEFTSNTDWVASDDLTQVFTGTITATANDWFEIEFDEPFEYTGGNLVIAVHEEAPGWTVSPTFSAYTSSENSGIVYRNDTTNPNPETPPAATYRVSKIAQIQFEMTMADCLPPTTGTITDITDTEALLSWTSDGSLFDITWGESGFGIDSEGTLIEGIEDSEYELTELTPLTDYQFYVRQDCDDDGFSAWVGPFSFTTEPSCVEPTDLSVSDTTAESTVLNWEGTSDLYDIEWGEAGFEQGEGTMVEGVTENPYTLESLDAETAYEFYVRQDCGEDDGVSEWAGPFYFFTGYCEVTSTNTSYGIGNFTTEYGIVNINNSSGSSGYSDYTSQYVAQFEGGADVAFTITPVSTSTHGMGIWIDWNNDLDFDDPGEQVYLSGSYVNPGTGTITIPAGTPVGDYRMRVVANWLSSSPIPCGDLGNGSYGEAEDYTFSVIEEPDCLPPTELAATALSLTSMELSWISDGDSFEVEWGEAGFEQGDGTIEIVTDTSLEVTTVTDTPYEFYVRQNCGDDGYSLWAGPFSFETGYCDPTYSYGCSNGAKISNFETNDAIMNIANNTGTSECGEGGYNNFTSMIAAAPENLVVSFTVGVGSWGGGVKIWIDWNNNGTFETGELIAESSATIAAGSEFTGTFSVPAGTPLGDYRMRVRVVEGNTSFDPCSNYSYGETEDYTFSVIEPPTCFPPSGVTIVQVTEDSIEVSWTAPAEQDSWQVIAVPAGSPAPDENTTGYETATEIPYTIEGLDPSTEYDVYVRANCGDEDGISLWAGPATTTTTQIPAEVDFEDDFEEEGGWTFTNGDQANQWHIGEATAYDGDTSLYISDDDGETNDYSDTTTYTHAIRDLAFPANTNDVTISFYWKGVGQGSGSYFYDYMTVWLMPSTYQPAEGVQITADDGGIQLGAEFNNQEDWVQYFELLELSDFAGQTGRLIFEWTNNTYTNNPPPAAVDNVEVKLVTCSRPIEVVVEKNQVTGDLLASWTPVAGETQWEVIVQLASDPAPDDTATGVIVDEPQYLIEDVEEGVFYKIYVRAICSEDDKSLWTEGVDFSDFNPPACANIDLEFPDLVMDEFGDFIFCAADGELTLDLVADFDASSFKATTSYEVEEIEYAPPFPFLGGIEMPITADDDYTASFDLPFNFCFFGNEYSYCRIGDNGVVTFGLPYTTTYGEYCPWTLSGPIPDPNFSIKNAIYGVFQDMLTTNNPGPDSQINYQVLGTYPCRALVVNFNEVPAFGSSCSGEQYRTTTQIVLYEITNIIEIYVANRTACSGWQSGLGVLGIQNEEGTVAYTPPGRNTGAWDAVEEAWRFSPSGEVDVVFEWYINGEFYSDNPNDQITVTGDTCVEARVTYPGCGGDDLVLSKEYCVKVAPEIILDQPEDIKVCLIDGQYDPINLFDKSDEAVATLSQNENFDINDYNITFYHSEDAAIAETNAIPNPTNYVPDPDEYIWIRVEHESTGCNAIISFRIYEGVGLALKRPADVILCVYYDIIPETDLSQVNDELLSNLSGEEELIVNYYHSQQDAINGNNPITDWDSFIAPSLPYEVWIKVSGSAEVCEAVTSFRLLEGEGLPEYEHVDFDICTAYVLPELPEGYFYTTEYLAEGDRINPGTVIEGLGLHAIYVNVISKEGCITSSSYNVNIIECSVPRGISPNGDGLNDRFELTDYFLLDLKIYNRDGREVYSHGMGYTNEWEGQSNNGSLLPDGTYYYRIVTPVEELTGWVQLVRETK